MRKRNAIIVGAGVAGLIAAWRLLKSTDVRPIVLEREKFIGGRKFFVDELTLSTWREILSDVAADAVPRKIFCRGKFFDCPVAGGWSTFKRFGLLEGLTMGASFLRTKLFPRDELTDEDRLINRVGQKFFETVLRGVDDEKIFRPDVRGVCEKISDEVKRLGGEVLTDADVKNFRVAGDVVKAVQVSSPAGELTFPADFFLASPAKTPTVELTADVLLNAPCRIHVNDPNVKLARVDIFGKRIRAEGSDISRAVEELVAMGVVNAAEVLGVNDSGFDIAAKNFYDVHDAEAVR